MHYHFFIYLNKTYRVPSPPFGSLISDLQGCWSTSIGVLSLTVLTVFNCLLLLPLCICVLYLGFNQWRQRRTGTVWSHSDIFTYHMTFIELLNIVGLILCFLGVHTHVTEMETVGIYLLANVFSGQMAFHILTCVERYLAVVHPVTYLSLKKANGIRIRSIIIGFVWLMCFLGMGILSITHHLIVTFVSFALIPIVLVVILYFSVSVLCALIRPGPGKRSRNRKQADQSKLRAFVTIMVILLVLLMRFLVSTSLDALYILKSASLESDENCGLWLSEYWFNLPSSLVLPVLFLHRAGKLSLCRNSNKSG